MAPQSPLFGRVLHASLPNRLAGLAKRFKSGKPFPHAVIDDFLDPEFCRRLTAEFPSAGARSPSAGYAPDRTCREDVRELGEAFRALDDALRSPECLEFAGRLSGIPNLLCDPSYAGAGARLDRDRMSLEAHLDFALHPRDGLYRRVNFLLYLNPEWRKEWGGSLRLRNRPWMTRGKGDMKVILPLLNRCVVFVNDDRSWHGVGRVNLPADRPELSRRSFAFHFYSRESPRGLRALPCQVTVFSASAPPKHVLHSMAMELAARPRRRSRPKE